MKTTALTALVALGFLFGLGAAFFLPVVLIFATIIALPLMAMYLIGRKWRPQWFESRPVTEVPLIDDEFAGATAIPFLLSDRPMPTVMIVDDDHDLAEMTAAIFQKFGCKTIISYGEDKTSEILSSKDVDIVVLDWMLGKDLVGSEVIMKAHHLIEGVKNLPHKSARVVTFSALDKKSIDLPRSHYFKHFDHWKKPFNSKQLSLKTFELLNAAGF